MIQLQLLEATPAWPQFPAVSLGEVSHHQESFSFCLPKRQVFQNTWSPAVPRVSRGWLSDYSGSKESNVAVVIQLCPTVCDPKAFRCQTSLCLTISQSLPKFMSIELVMLYNHLILCCPFLLLPSIFPSIRVFSNESALCIRWPKYWSFSFSISPSNEYSGLISFTTDWFDLLVVQGTLKSLLWHHNSKVSILQSLAFFMVHLKKVLIAWITTMVWSLT